MIVALPWWLFITSVAVLDWILDWVFIILFFWAPIIAKIFIWIINIAHLPFTILGYIDKVRYDLFAFFIEGWMLLFNFSGCFVFIGRHCSWFGESNYRTYLDIPIFWKYDDGTTVVDRMQSLVMPPALESVESVEDIHRVRATAHKVIADLTPLSTEIQDAVDAIHDLFAF